MTGVSKVLGNNVNKEIDAEYKYSVALERPVMLLTEGEIRKD